MYRVNGKFFDLEAVRLRWDELGIGAWLSNGNSTRVALCFEDAADLLPALLYMKEHGISVLALPAESGEEAAMRTAENAKCEVLIYHGKLIHLEVGALESQGAAALIQMSSGTTGAAKVIERAWASIDQEIAATVSGFTKPEGKTVIIACPVSHSYGFISAFLVGLERGAKIEVVSNANPKGVLKALMRNPEHILYAAPVYLQILCQLIPAGMVFDSAMTSGVQMSAPQYEEVKRGFKNLYQQYGCSELGCVSICDELIAPNQIGKPLSHLQVSAGESEQDAAEIVVLNHDGREVATGDLGYFSGDSLHYLSRLGDMINVAGVNVYPGEVESVLLSHPEVGDAVIFGVADDVSHQKVHAAWVAKPGFQDEQALLQFLSQKLTKHQLPAKLHLVEKIQKSPNGKVSRKKISQSLA